MRVRIERAALDTAVRGVWSCVDFADFEHYGNYRANVLARYLRHFSL